MRKIALLFIAVLILPVFAEAADKGRLGKDLKSRKSHVRSKAVDEIKKSRSADGGAVLLEQYKTESDESVKLHIVSALATARGGDEIAAELRKIARQDSSEQVRAAACRSMGIMKQPQFVPVLAEIARDASESETVRSNAASSLVFYIGEPGTEKIMEEILKKDGSAAVRGALVRSMVLAPMKSEAAKRLLAIGSKDSHEDVRDASNRLLGARK